MFHKSHRKPVVITAPAPDISFQYPPPAHLLTQQQQEQEHRHRDRTPVHRLASTGSSSNTERSSAAKEEKKKKFSLFKKNKKKEEPSTRRATRTPDVSGRKQLVLSYPDTAPVSRRPHSSASNHCQQEDNLHRHGSQRSVKSSDFLADEDEDDIDSSLAPPTDYPCQQVPLRELVPKNRRGSGEYDSLESHVTEQPRPRSNSARVERFPKEGAPPPRIIPHRPAPPPPSASTTSSRQPRLQSPAKSDAPPTTPMLMSPPVEQTVGVASLPPVPGLLGIKNHGNTCFMNAILQCLGNTEQFLHYLLSGECEKELATLKRRRRKRPTAALPGGSSLAVTSPSYSTQGETLCPDSPGAVADVLVLLLKSLWGGQYEAKVSAVFKEVVGLWAEQYRGRNQHDAQEFLLWLLGDLHDNLSLATRQQLSKTPPPFAHTDKDPVATETNSSLVYNLFGGEYRSTLHCPECGNDSNTYDPYLCISLSVPRRGTRPIYITMARRHQNSTRLMTFGLRVKVTATVQDIQRQLAIEAHSLPHYLVVGNMKEDGFCNFYHSTDPVALIQDDMCLYAYEVTPYKGDFMIPVIPSPVKGGDQPRKSTETIYIILQNRVGQGEYSKRFGGPLCLRVWRDFTYSQLQSVVFKGIRKYLHEGVNPEVICRDYIFFKCRVLDGLQGQEYLDPYCPTPLQTPTVEKALSLSKLWGYELHIKIIAEWEQWIKDCVCTEVPDVKPLIHDSVQEVKAHFDIPLEATLDDCLQWHTQEEKLEDEESWTCPQCRRPQNGAKKRITFSSLPDVLVVHLKRFEQDEYTQSKLDTLVKFPLRALDMSPFLAKPEIMRPNSAQAYHSHSTKPINGVGGVGLLALQESKSSTLPSKTVHFQKSSRKSSRKFFVFKKGKKSKKSPPLSDSTSSEVDASPGILTNRNHMDSLYDLYAVCYHHGDMNRGHYIAHCLNPVDNRWYKFDDHHVLPVRDREQIVTQDAYILFYTKRSTRERWLKCLPSLSFNQTDKKGPSSGHWIAQLIVQCKPLNLHFLPSLDHSLFSPQRQGSVTSAHTMSTASGVSPDNIFFPAHVSQLPPDVAHPPQGNNRHLRQFSASSSGPTSPHNTLPYPHSLPSPSIASTPSYFSQPYQPPPSGNFFGRRAGSFHGNIHHHTHSNDIHSATRV